MLDWPGYSLQVLDGADKVFGSLAFFAEQNRNDNDVSHQRYIAKFWQNVVSTKNRL